MVPSAAVVASTSNTSPAWQTHFSREELRDLIRVRSWRGWLSIALDWAIIAAAFALVALRPNPLTLVLALFLIGGRQLGLAVLMHEAAHGTLLRNRRWNDLAATWLCAYPVWSDLYIYRPYHLKHHATTWTAEDPDLGLASPFPVTRQSFRRKVWRDLNGRTGVKRLRTILRYHRIGANFDAGRAVMGGVLLTNGILLLLLTLAGHPALYLLWVGAWLTTYSLAMRIRSIAEHGVIPEPSDDLRNTRTTLARWWERLFIAPNRVNYHLEHHLMVAVPHYNLPRLHRLLRERGVLEGACVAPGYLSVLRLAASRS
jgi:fatty acid desaturase